MQRSHSLLLLVILCCRNNCCSRMDVTPASYSDGAGSKFGTGTVVTLISRLATLSLVTLSFAYLTVSLNRQQKYTSIIFPS